MLGPDRRETRSASQRFLLFTSMNPISIISVFCFFFVLIVKVLITRLSLSIFSVVSGDPQAADRPAIIAVFKTRTSPIFELLPWFVPFFFSFFFFVYVCLHQIYSYILAQKCCISLCSSTTHISACTEYFLCFCVQWFCPRGAQRRAETHAVPPKFPTRCSAHCGQSYRFNFLFSSSHIVF